MNLQRLILKLRLQIMQLVLPKKPLSAKVRQSIALLVEAISDLDQAVEIENFFCGRVDYSTVHGSRSVGIFLEFNQFLVVKEGAGFARAREIPYLYFPSNKAANSSLRMPNMLLNLAEVYPAAALIVCITSDNQEATDAGYANAVPIPGLRSNVYIENLKMLDTDYADSLVDFTRFGG